jgi:outer membrane immunogenic protein
MKKILLGVVGLMALGAAAPASAADLPAKVYTKAPAMVAAVYDWSGFYIGANGGGGWSHKCWDVNNIVGIVIAPAFREGCANASGGVAGGQVGYRWQAGPWVFGVEGQGDWAGLRGSFLSSPALLGPFGFPVTDRSRVDAFGLLTGQVGYAWNNVLWYGKGGAAVTGDKYEGIATATGLVFDRATETRWGGVLGTGIEVGFAPNWSVAFEYDHLFMGTRTLNFVTVPGGIADRSDRIRQDVDLATIRVNYRWGGPVVAKY